MLLRTHYVEDAKKEIGKEVTLAGWVHETRDLGKVRFLILRDKTGTVQITAKKAEADAAVFDLMEHPKETVVAVTGKVLQSKIANAGAEVFPSKIEVLGKITAKVPFEVSGKVPVELDVRLDHRYVDLRAKKAGAIFKIKSEVAFAFREKLRSLGFDEIHPTCIVAEATEGGTDLFKVQYFEKEAYLAQSPQLYKQLAVIGGMDRVFMTTPVFRAEKHNTNTHLNEVLQMDIEMGFADQDDAMDVLEAVVLHVLAHVKKNCAQQLAELEQASSDLRSQPSQTIASAQSLAALGNVRVPSVGAKLEVPKKIPRHTYSELVERLQKAGDAIEFGHDFGREHEAKLAQLLGHDTYFVTKWPTSVRAFYSMPTSEDPKICNAFDLMFGGLEIASGAQRIHIPELLEEALRRRQLNPKNFEFYINAFRVGAPPHAGWSIGIERFTMKICGQQNIRECAMFPRDRVRLTP